MTRSIFVRPVIKPGVLGDEEPLGTGRFLQ